MASPAPPAPLAIASTLGFAWAGIMLAISVVVSASVVSQGASLGVMALPAALSIASGVAAHGVRRGRWPWFALGASAAWIAFLVLVPLKVSVPGILVNFVILGLVLTNLRRFR